MFNQEYDKKTLILLTTAITRGDLHKQSIELFYSNMYNDLIDDYDIIHIINIDYPIKLREKDTFCPQKTKELLDEIIPSDIRKIFIMQSDDTPSFAKAYKKVINCIYENDLFVIHNNPILWWLEDDWTMFNYYNFVSLFRLINSISFDKSKNTINEKIALSITDNAPLCSFRGGPIMSSAFFETYFDISSQLDDIKDPEYKVGKNIKCNETIKVYDTDIFIICVFIYSQIKPPYTMKPSCYWWYEERMKTMRFKKNCGITYIMAIMQEPNSEKIHYKTAKNAETLTLKDINKYKKNGFVKCSISQFNKMKEHNSLNYVTIVPHIFKDIGRDFNKTHMLENNK